MNRAATKIIENGRPQYVVVCPKKAPPNVINALDMLVEAIQAKTGVRINRKSDGLPAGASHNPNEKAILIGKTNYEESQEVLSTLKPFEYKIAEIGSKVVVASLDDTYLQTAINYYINNLLDKNLIEEEGGKTLFLEEYHFVPEKLAPSLITVNRTSITEFAIVYPHSDPEYRRIGEDLQKVILANMGAELPVYSDSEAERTNEILLGRTNRAFSQSVYSSTKKYIMTHSLEVSGSKLQIHSGGYLSALRCVVDMMSLFSPTNGKTELVDGSYRRTEILAAPTALSSEADIRVMTSNLLHAEWADDRIDVVYRAEIFAGILRDYLPDSVGLQEMTDRWQNELVKWFGVLREEYGVEYSLCNNLHIYKNRRANCTALLYRSDKYDCVDNETRICTHWTPNMGISLTMFHLQSKEDSSKEYIHINTHWDADSWTGARKDAISNESSTLFNKWKRAGCPIFMTGDWNAIRGQACMENFITATEAKTADDDTYCIEFTFYYGENIAVRGREILVKFSQLSDHYFRYTDFTLR